MGHPALAKFTNGHPVPNPGSTMIYYLLFQDTMSKLLLIQHLIGYSKNTSLTLEILQMGQHTHATLNMI